MHLSTCLCAHDWVHKNSLSVTKTQPKTIGCQCENGNLLKIGTLEVDNNDLSPYGWSVHFVHVINNCEANLNQNVHNFL